MSQLFSDPGKKGTLFGETLFFVGQPPKKGATEQLRCVCKVKRPGADQPIPSETRPLAPACRLAPQVTIPDPACAVVEMAEDARPISAILWVDEILHN